MEKNKQRVMRLPVDKLLGTLNLTGSRVTGMSSRSLKKFDEMVEASTSPMPHPDTIYINITLKGNESNNAKEPKCSSFGKSNLIQALRVNIDDLLISAQEKMPMIIGIKDRLTS